MGNFRDKRGRWITLPGDWQESENIEEREYRPLYTDEEIYRDPTRTKCRCPSCQSLAIHPEDLTKMSDATEFLAWLIEDIETVSAVVDSPRDHQLQIFEKRGFLQLQWTYGKDRQYQITSKGATEGLAL